MQVASGLDFVLKAKNRRDILARSVAVQVGTTSKQNKAHDLELVVTPMS